MTAKFLAEAMAEVAQAIEKELDRLLPRPQGPERRLHEAMRHAALGGGKRLRPFLTHATGRMLGAATEPLIRAGAAIELIHAYSLVHDDLPAMDDAELRRGKPTCHRAFDEATAILAGDALQTLAFEALTRDDVEISAATRIELVSGLARAAGHAGMCGGQEIDLEAEGRSLDLAAIKNLQQLKTGALIGFAVDAGAIHRRCDPGCAREFARLCHRPRARLSDQG